MQRMADGVSPRIQPSASYSFTMRLHLPQQGTVFADVAHAIAEAAGLLGAIDLVRVEGDRVVRDVTVSCGDSEHAEAVVRAVRALEGVHVDSVSDRTFLMHKGGKIEVRSKLPLKTRDDLSMAYTPGVARVSLRDPRRPERQAWALTIKGNCVAVVSDGTAVLGLGDIGPAAAMPVMEGKAMLFKEFAGVDAFPLCIDTTDVDEIVAFVKAVAPTFGGINLEDIAAPRCFEIERRLRAELDIPVFHDDQHGTAIVVLAALLNALRVVGKRPEDITVVVVGRRRRRHRVHGDHARPGRRRRGRLRPAAARCTSAPTGSTPAQADARRAHQQARADAASPTRCWPAPTCCSASPAPAPSRRAAVRTMAPGAIVFAMANPIPEVRPEEVRGDVAIMATGRSDYPNQINNVLAFPGVFKGALEVRARTINEEMKLAAAQAIAAVIPAEELHPDYIIPSVFNRKVAAAVAEGVAAAAVASGVARRKHEPDREPATPIEALP